MTPMLSQYLEIKAKYPDAILFYRMGDFYEMFFEDALRAAPVLEVQLTARDKNAENPIPMCGVPFHAASSYIQKLLAAGLKVAICEQMEEAGSGKGLVKREVVRVVTPALVGDPELVSDQALNLLLCLHSHGNLFEVCLLDLLGGQVRHGNVDSLPALLDLFYQALPKEILIPASLKDESWLKEISKKNSSLVTIRDAYFSKTEVATGTITLSALDAYLQETQKREHLPHLKSPLPLFESEVLSLDVTSLNALEIIKSQSLLSDGKSGSLYDLMDNTTTPMGRRTLKEWLMRPLSHLQKIEARLDAVSDLCDEPSRAESLRTILSSVRDLERLTTKTALGLAMPRDLVAIREVLKSIPPIQEVLRNAKASLLQEIGTQLSPLSDLVSELEKALLDEPSANLREGGIFRDGFHPDIVEYRSLSKNTKSTIAAIENREKTRTGIPGLKIRYSRVFGYTFEITKSYLNRVPEDYTRKQTIANGERFITEELKTLEEKIITADYKLRVLEESLFLELRQKVANVTDPLLLNSKLLAQLDVLQSFSSIARKHTYVRPKMHAGWELQIEEGRHPVVETLLPPGQFVPNSVSFSEGDCRTLIITGPNMAGKSTIMRQIALIVLLAHAGSFVPAQAALIPLVDSIYTRIGSSDDLARGRSTFMVEMTEMSRILEKATPQSLILIDEIGRGTSTYDGLSLAWSLLEFIHTQVRAKTLFATHFHEVTSLEMSLPALKNVNVLVEKWKEEIVFLHKLGAGICNQSFGIEVARLAGLPSKVLLRAREILGLLETQSQRGTRTRNRALDLHNNQMAFFDGSDSPENRSGIEN